MDEERARILEEIGRVIGKGMPIVETIQALKDENERLKEAVEWAAAEMLTGDNRWFETSRPGEKYYDWFVRELRLRAGMEGPKL
jgi:thymidine phosphorylase